MWHDRRPCPSARIVTSASRPTVSFERRFAWGLLPIACSAGLLLGPSYLSARIPWPLRLAMVGPEARAKRTSASRRAGLCEHVTKRAVDRIAEVFTSRTVCFVEGHKCRALTSLHM
jgi:hypothetical protein